MSKSSRLLMVTCRGRAAVVGEYLKVLVFVFHRHFKVQPLAEEDWHGEVARGVDRLVLLTVIEVESQFELSKTATQKEKQLDVAILYE